MTLAEEKKQGGEKDKMKGKYNVTLGLSNKMTNHTIMYA